VDGLHVERAIGFVNFGQLGRLDVKAPVQTFGPVVASWRIPRARLIVGSEAASASRKCKSVRSWPLRCDVVAAAEPG